MKVSECEVDAADSGEEAADGVEEVDAGEVDVDDEAERGASGV